MGDVNPLDGVCGAEDDRSSFGVDGGLEVVEVSQGGEVVG